MDLEQGCRDDAAAQISSAAKAGEGAAAFVF